MNKLIRLPRLAAVTAAVLFILVLGIGKAVAQDEMPVPVDIKPGSCPNPINVKSHGVLPVAILGTADFDLQTVNLELVPSLVHLVDLEGGEVAPLRSAFEDVATPLGDPLLDCTEEGADGFLDLTLKFSTHQVVEALSLSSVMDRTEVVLTLTGELELMDGTFMPIIGEDVVLILNKVNRGRSALAPGRNKLR